MQKISFFIIEQLKKYRNCPALDEMLTSIADTTTGREPWMRKPNSPATLLTVTVLLHSKKQMQTDMSPSNTIPIRTSF